MSAETILEMKDGANKFDIMLSLFDRQWVVFCVKPYPDVLSSFQAMVDAYTATEDPHVVKMTLFRKQTKKLGMFKGKCMECEYNILLRTGTCKVLSYYD